jgi:hypothetical protein
MNTVVNVKKVSLIFFIVLVGGHLFSTLMLANDYYSESMVLMNGILDIPAILSAIIYAFTSLKLYIEENGKSTKVFDLVAGIIGGIVLLAAIYLNFFA